MPRNIVPSLSIYTYIKKRNFKIINFLKFYYFLIVLFKKKLINKNINNNNNINNNYNYKYINYNNNNNNIIISIELFGTGFKILKNIFLL